MLGAILKKQLVKLLLPQIRQDFYKKPGWPITSNHGTRTQKVVKSMITFYSM